MKSNVEKHTVDGTVMKVIHRGNRKVEFLLENFSKEIREKILEVVDSTSYTEDESELTSNGRLISQLPKSHNLSFQELIKKILKLMVERILHYEKKGGKHAKKTGRQSKKSVRGHQRGALAT